MGFSLNAYNNIIFRFYAHYSNTLSLRLYSRKFEKLQTETMSWFFGDANKYLLSDPNLLFTMLESFHTHKCIIAVAARKERTDKTSVI